MKPPTQAPARAHWILKVGLLVFVVFNGLVILEMFKVLELCANSQIGAHVNGLRDRYGLSVRTRGPHPMSAQAGREQVVYCGTLTRCAFSCSVVLQDGVITEADLGPPGPSDAD